MNAQPFVPVEDENNTEEKVLHCQQCNLTSTETAKLVTLIPFQELNKNINIKYEILNMMQLEYLREYGCRILSLDSEINDPNGHLCIEGKNG